ncbi:MAG TPA: glycosyltransferase family 2 protein [Thermoanaerobaculia bacterium]
MGILSWVILAAWILALGRTILNLVLIPRLRRERPAALPRVSVIVPARNEERTIEQTVRALLAQRWEALEVIVVDDRSTDATGSILDAIAAEDARLRPLRGDEPPAGWLGKPWALHQGSRVARGELFLFVDADVQYEPEALPAAVARFERSGVAMLSLFPRIVMQSFWEHIAMSNLAVVAFTFMPLWLGNRTRIPLLGIGGGPGNLVDRLAYERSGGHEALRDAVVDDVALARLLRRKGHRTEVALASELVSIRMYHGLREIVDGFTKNVFAAFNRSYAVTTFFLLAGILTHGVPYGMAIAGDGVALATLLIIVLSRLVLFSALRYRLDSALLGHPLMMLTWGWILMRSVWFTGVRKELHWRGRRYDAEETRFGAD